MSTTHENYVRQLLAQFDADPDRAAVISRDVTFTAGELAAATRRAAGAMRREGIARGDVVGILTEPNTAATLILRWAANLLGATAAYVRGMNAVSPDDELRFEQQRAIVADVGARMLAVDVENAERARDLLTAAPAKPVLAVLGPTGPDTVDLTTGSEGDGATDPEITDDDLAMITQTSGSSGRPKGVCWTFGIKNDMATSALARSGRVSLLITAPLTHSSGFGADDTLITGGLVVLHHGFDAGAVLRTVARHRIGRLILGTPQVYALATHPDRPGTDLSSLTEIIYTGSPAAPLRLQEALEIFGPILLQVYGTTETGVISMLPPDDHHDLGRCATVGRPLNPAALSIRDPETGAPVAPGEVGEVCAVPRWLMAGYWHEPELTAQIIRDGWVRTGDLARLDADGYLHLSGRLADMMKVKGIRIHPEAVERVLNQAPGVSQAAVCGVENADRVEQIYAAVVPRPGVDVDVEDLRRHVSEALTENHVPSVIDLCRELPVVGPGKPDRAQLRARAHDAFGRDVSRV
ncbi:AMP-binding protein [Actinoplanes sp. NPDC051475]|uniref:AMP-binding protein n=1 Tax=Actinoplanes sp. NPDC051475 TaxID=3157225 RepID=UPI00344C3BE1